MLNYLFRRLGGAIPTLFIIIAGTFFMMRLAPGGPFAKERVVPPEVEANLMKAYHLDEPLWQQFLRYLNGLAHCDFGPSFKYKDFTVAELIFGGFPVSTPDGVRLLPMTDDRVETHIAIVDTEAPSGKRVVHFQE